MVAIWITVSLQGLFSRFVTIWRYGKWLTDSSFILILNMAALVRHALAEVCTVLVLLVFNKFPVVSLHQYYYFGLKYVHIHELSA